MIVAFRILYTSGRFEIIIFKKRENPTNPSISPFKPQPSGKMPSTRPKSSRTITPSQKKRANQEVDPPRDLAKIKSAENHLPSPLLQATVPVMKAKNKWLLVLVNRAYILQIVNSHFNIRSISMDNELRVPQSNTNSVTLHSPKFGKWLLS